MNIPKELRTFAKDLSILIVEDDILLNTQLVEIAQLFFKDVRFALNGEEGLESYTQNHADIVVTDITMPKMNGIEMSKKIKDIDNEQSIIIISAHCHLDYPVEVTEIGIKEFVRKPFDDSELLYRLLKVSKEIIKIKEQKHSLLEENLVDEKVIVTQKIVKTMSPRLDKLASYREKIIADSAMDQHDIEIDIHYLLELSENFKKNIMLMNTHKIQDEYLLEIIFILKQMYTTISRMPPLVGLSLMIFDLASFLEIIQLSTFNDVQKEKFKDLALPQQDIAKFLNVIFFNEEVINIHSFEDSLENSIEKFKENILNIEVV